MAGGSPMLLTTDPTNVPRILFVDSKFDHEKHKEETCISCHANVYGDAIPTPSDASIASDQQVRQNKPLEWDIQQLQETARLLTPTAISSCTQCHNPTGSGAHPASSSCITCHDYHEREKNLLPQIKTDEHR
jgi:hypothetical protein